MARTAQLPEEPASAPPVESEPEEQGGKRMPFLEHLADLRNVLRRSVMAVTVTTIISYIFREELFALLARPLIEAWNSVATQVGIGSAQFVYTGAMEPFMVLFKLSLLVGVFAASPAIFFHLWSFISPALYPRERRWGLVFVISSVLLFVGGGAFAYVYVLPAGYKYFLGYSSDSIGIITRAFGKSIHVTLSQPFAIRPMLTLDEYFGLTSMLLLVFGLVFELPLLLSILAMLGIVSAKTLWKFNRYAILLFAIAGALLTPGDLVVGQLAMTGALTVLYNLSIVLALFVGKDKKRFVDAEQ